MYDAEVYLPYNYGRKADGQIQGGQKSRHAAYDCHDPQKYVIHSQFPFSSFIFVTLILAGLEEKTKNTSVFLTEF